jgi:ankyrin repeat protein
MLAIRAAGLACVLVLTARMAAVADRNDMAIRVTAAVTRSLPLLQQSAHTWSIRRDCSSCHHQSLGSLAVAVAKERGFGVDEALAREQLDFTLKSRDEAVAMDTYLQGRGVINGQVGLGYALVGLAGSGQPADRTTDVLSTYIAGRQFPDGRIPSASHRAPLEDSAITATALAIRALKVYAPERGDAIARAGRWLTAATPRSNEDRAYQLFGLRWLAGARLPQIARRQALLREQRADGGWGQVATMKGDAYATGQALVALNQTGLPASDPAYIRGVRFLLDDQLDDGSWHVVSIRRDEGGPGLEYFETGYPHGRDQFISYAGAAWATLALTLTRGNGDSPALTRVAPAARSGNADTGWTEGTTPLMKAALRGTVDEVRKLLDAGADPNAANAEGSTALMFASLRDEGLARILLDRAANVNARTRDGFTALMMAAGQAGSASLVKLLLDRGAKVDGVEPVQWTPLLGAVKGGDLGKTRLLLEAGEKAEIASRVGVELARIAVLQEDGDMLDLLVANGLDAGRPLNNARVGRTPLMLAAMAGLEVSVDRLLRHHVDPNARDPRGMTALMYAMLRDRGNDRIVRALLAAGADASLKSDAQLTARDYALKYGATQLAEALPR